MKRRFKWVKWKLFGNQKNGKKTHFGFINAYMVIIMITKMGNCHCMETFGNQFM
jgi:hypothetical protein